MTALCCKPLVNKPNKVRIANTMRNNIIKINWNYEIQLVLTPVYRANG